MPERSPPPPASDRGLGLDEVIGGKPPKPKPALVGSTLDRKPTQSQSCPKSNRSQGHPSIILPDASRRTSSSSKPSASKKTAPSSSSNPAKKSTSARTSFRATEVAETARVETEHAELFDNRRTFAQGLAVPTKYQSQFQPTVVASAKAKGLVKASKYIRENEGITYPAHTGANTKSMAPSFAKSVFKDSSDAKMASRQTHFASLTPQEQTRQNMWAQTMIQRINPCPQGYEWNRIDAPSGYHCRGRNHFISDELLAEGKGGIYVVPGGKIKKMDPLWGPYYKGPSSEKSLVYFGDPNTYAPEYISANGHYSYNKIWRICPDLTGPPTTQSEVDKINYEIVKLMGPRKRELTLEDFQELGRRGSHVGSSRVGSRVGSNSTSHGGSTLFGRNSLPIQLASSARHHRTTGLYSLRENS
jgi:hypothetical protein